MMLTWCEVRDKTNQGQNTIATKNGFDGTIVFDSRPNGRSYQLSNPLLQFFFPLTVASPSTTFGFSILLREQVTLRWSKRFS